VCVAQLLGNMSFELCTKTMYQNVSLGLRRQVRYLKNYNKEAELVSYLLNAHKSQSCPTLSTTSSW